MEEEFKKLELNQKWDEHFTSLMKKSRVHTTDVAKSPENNPLNRYLDVTPYDRSRVKLIRKIGDSDYINASLVTVPKAARQYILTQGPLPETISHFWLMVWEQKSNVIVMLNKTVESFVKCEQYWPDKKNETIHFEDVNLFVTLDTVKETKHYTVREMTLRDGVSDKKRAISQFHYTAWPDHGQPDSPTSLLRLLTAVRRSGGLDKMDEPTIVHCSAGIGRSGTFCLIDSVLSIIENQSSAEAIDIDNTLIEMRDYRGGLIQSATQLRFAYMSIIYGVKILEKANKLNPHISSIKDSTFNDNLSKEKTNGFTATSNNGTNNTKKSRRGKKSKQSNTNDPSSLNIFKKQLLVDTLDGVDSDTAEKLFYDAMRPWPNIKKPRNSSPEDLDDELDCFMIERKPNKIDTDADDNASNSDLNKSTSRDQPSTKAELLTNAINSLLTEKTISTKSSSLSSDTTASQGTESVLLRRRERELRNQRIAEKTVDIKNRMKAEELRREVYARRISFAKKSALYGGIALVLSSLVYVYIHSNS